MSTILDEKDSMNKKDAFFLGIFTGIGLVSSSAFIRQIRHRNAILSGELPTFQQTMSESMRDLGADMKDRASKEEHVS